MLQGTQDIYLGNVVHFSGNLSHTIDQRISKGQGIISEISAFLRDVPLGPARIQTGLILREAKFLNAILFSSESWHGITLKDVQSLEHLDQFLLRVILYRAH